MTKHTEGPWHYGEFPLTESGNIYVWNEGESVLCAEVPTEEAGPDGAKANAALISAAPEMLDTLRSFVKSFSSDGEYNHHSAEIGIAELREMARNAIRKAQDVSQFVDE